MQDNNTQALASSEATLLPRKRSSASALPPSYDLVPAETAASDPAPRRRRRSKRRRNLSTKAKLTAAIDPDYRFLLRNSNAFDGDDEHERVRNSESVHVLLRGAPAAPAAQPPRTQHAATSPTSSASGPGHTVYEVEDFLSHYVDPCTHVTYYYVHWKGFPETAATWEPAKHVRGAPAVLLRYERRVAKYLATSGRS